MTLIEHTAACGDDICVCPDDVFWGRLLGDNDPCAPGKDWAAAAFGDIDEDEQPGLLACCDHCGCVGAERIGHGDTCAEGCNDEPCMCYTQFACLARHDN